MFHPSETHLAPYAIRSAIAGGRVHEEPDDPLRGPFVVDRHRIIECVAFRRLEHKTQVFTPEHHDHFRTRLTHTLEVAQIARCLAVQLRANEALVEVIALAHDLGHPPFGHAGEAALNEAMAGVGGFNHNAHTLRVVEFLEHPFPAFRGLNLTEASLAGLRTHATRYDIPRAAGLSPRGAPSVEAQIASVADRIAYNCHDLEDAIGAELVDHSHLEEVTLWHSAYERVAHRHDAKSIHAIRRVVLDTMLDVILADVINTSSARLASVRSAQEAESAARTLVVPSETVETQLIALEQLLVDRVYSHLKVVTNDAEGRGVVLALFDAYRSEPDALPPRFATRVGDQGLDSVICDYIAGMTDRFCKTEHERLLGR